MVQRPDHVAVLLPRAGHPAVQRREPVRAAAPQVRAQLGAQEGMDPEGAARGTGPGDERRRALQLREHVPGVGALREDGGERGGDLVADTDGGEHVRDVGGQPGEDLAGEVVREVGVPGEVTQQGVGVGRPGERPRREGQGRGPALGLRAQEVEPVGAHRDPGGGEQGRRLVPGEREVARAQVDDLLTQPEAVEPQRRVGPRGEHQQQVGGPVAKERGQPVQRVRCGDGVDVVEDQGDRARRGEGVDDRRDERRVPARRGRPRQCPRRPVRARHAVERREQGGPEPAVRVVVGVERDPGPGPVRQPVGEELRLAEPGGRTDHDDLSGGRAVQHAGQPRPGEEGRGHAGARALRGRHDRPPRNVHTADPTTAAAPGPVDVLVRSATAGPPAASAQRGPRSGRSAFAQSVSRGSPAGPATGDGWRSFDIVFDSIWRIRSRVTP